ncbi:MAG: LytR C-terminal domain-containing protein [Eubacterium sp.]|nr:LytR C-terminal domain-containing protein [Eubacterium sp.]
MAKKKKKSTVGIFFSFFLKAIVIILGLVILAMGAYLVKYTLTEEDKASEQELDDNVLVDVDDDIFFASDTDVDEEADEDALFDNDEGADDIKADEKIVVLNATETSGLASAWRDKLKEAGYENIEIGNYFGNKLDTTRIVVMEEGKGETLKALVPNATLETGEASSIECDANVDGAKAFIIVGKSDDIVSQ